MVEQPHQRLRPHQLPAVLLSLHAQWQILAVHLPRPRILENTAAENDWTLRWASRSWSVARRSAGSAQRSRPQLAVTRAHHLGLGTAAEEGHAPQTVAQNPSALVLVARETVSWR